MFSPVWLAGIACQGRALCGRTGCDWGLEGTLSPPEQNHWLVPACKHYPPINTHCVFPSICANELCENPTVKPNQNAHHTEQLSLMTYMSIHILFSHPQPFLAIQNQYLHNMDPSRCFRILFFIIVSSDKSLLLQWFAFGLKFDYLNLWNKTFEYLYCENQFFVWTWNWHNNICQSVSLFNLILVSSIL